MGLLSTIGGASARAYGFTRSAVAAAKDAYFNLVTLLLNTSSTNGAQNNTFLDSSTNNFTITRNGNTTQGTFTPFSQTGWSNLFNGSNDYLSIPSATNLQLTTASAFTIEAWVYPTSSLTGSGAKGVVGKRGGYIEWQMYFATGGELTINGTSAFSGGTVVNQVNQWVHVAITWDTTTLRFFVNGTLNPNTYTTTFALNTPTTNQVVIGATNSGSEFFPGYISNFRMVKGTAVYTASFTPSTTPLTAITNTQLLTCQSNRFVDNSSNAYTITANNTPSVQAFSPFAPTAAYDSNVVGGSASFDASGDYLTAASNAAFNLSTGDFTIDFWVWFNQTADTSGGGQCVISGTTAAYPVIYVSTNGGTTLSFAHNSSIVVGGTIQKKAWNHVALCRSGTSLRFFVNGALAQTATYSTAIDFGGVYVGAQSIGGVVGYLDGYISGLRLVKGSAVYTAAFTPPTAPPTAITNTQLLLNYTNAGITDVTAKNVLETVGNAQISTTQSKFGGSSMYFDGTGDWLLFPSSPLLALGAGDFTVEFWAYTGNTASRGGVVGNRTGSGGDAVWCIVLNPTNVGSFGYIYLHTDATAILGSSTNFSANTWFHVAVTRSGTTVRMFLNGTQVGSTTSSINFSASNLWVGAEGSRTGQSDPLNGYIDDLRITKGYARYTANFTPPTQAFALQ